MPQELSNAPVSSAGPVSPSQSPTRVKMARGRSLEDKVTNLSLDLENAGMDNNNHLPTLNSTNNSNHTPAAARNSNQNHHQQQQQQQQGGGSGSMLSFGWLERQREKRRRQNLQQQAEEQLQKILQAELARKAAEGGGIDDSSKSCPESHEFERHRISRTRSASSTGSAFSSDDGKVATVSKSGEGASGHLDLSNVLGVSESDEEEEEEFPVPPVRVQRLEIDNENPFILNKYQMHALATYVLPKTIAFCRWRRLYGLNRDGDSFEACLRLIGSVQRTLMVIRTSRGEIFGGYAESPWNPRDKGGAPEFYGSAAACLFSFSERHVPKKPGKKTRTCFKFSGNSLNNTATPASPLSPIYINVFRWSGKNRYVQLCDTSAKMIAFGGGGNDGAFGVCVQEDFQRGSTGPCDTFDNDPLCPEGSFDIVDVEFWEFMTGQF